MSKRFTETTKWSDPWFRKLEPKYKLLWDWFCTNCDAAGTIDPDFGLASFVIGENYSEEDLSVFSQRIVLLPCKRYWIKKFIDFQYSKLSRDCKAHNPVYELINRLSIPYPYPTSNHKDIYKEKDKNKEKEKDTVQNRKMEDLANYLRNSYNEISGNTSPKEQTLKNIEKQLSEYPEEHLLFALVEYLNSVTDRESKHKYICSNFFGKDKLFLDYLPKLDNDSTIKRVLSMKETINKEVLK